MRQQRASRRLRTGHASASTLQLNNSESTTTRQAQEDREGEIQFAPAGNPLARHTKGIRARTGRVEAANHEELIPGVLRHSRYLSNFADDVIRVDVRHHQAQNPDVLTIDLTTQAVACDGGRSHYRTPQPALQFRDATDAFKVALNNTLERYHEGAVHDAVHKCRRTFLRIFAWMARNCVYRFEDLNRDLLDQLVADVALHGWTDALGQTELLFRIVDRARNDADLLARLQLGQSNSTTRFVLPLGPLEAITGLPLYQWAIPRSVYEEFASLQGTASRPVRKEDIAHKSDQSLSSIKTLMKTLNALSLTTPGSIQFVPFPNVQGAAEKAFRAAKQLRSATVTTLENKQAASPIDSEDDGAADVEATKHVGAAARHADDPKNGARNPTTNLTVGECAAIFEEALRWTYDYAPAILDTVHFAQNRLRQVSDNSSSGLKKAWDEIHAHYESKALAAKLPISTITQRNTGQESLIQVVKTLQYALFVNFGLNSARRVNELIGKGRVPYGLYRGALRKLQDTPPIYQLDSYVSKGPMNWFLFPANVLMADAYFVLERLHDLFNEPEHQVGSKGTSTIEEARTKKLFTFRHFTPGQSNSDQRPMSLDIAERTTFLRLAGVDPERFDRSQTPFRRMFSVLFLHRYDLREHPALQTYLGHLDASTTGGYTYDRVARPFGESIRELHAPDYVDTDLMKELDSAGLEYTAEQLLKMLNGALIGGGFPVVAAKLARELSAEVSFAKLSVELKAKELARRLHEAGHRPTPMPHTCCMAGQPKRTGEMAKCYRDGSLHREEASPPRCNGCVHSSVGEAYLAHMQDELQEEEELAQDSTLPAALRQAHDRRAASLRRSIALEQHAASRNRNLFRDAQRTWEQVVVNRKTPKAPAPQNS